MRSPLAATVAAAVLIAAVPSAAAGLAPTPARAVAAPGGVAASGSGAVKRGWAPTLRYRPRHRILVIRARPGTLRMVSRTAAGRKRVRRVVVHRRVIRRAVPAGVVRVRVRVLTPVKSRWVTLRIPSGRSPVTPVSPADPTGQPTPTVTEPAPDYSKDMVLLLSLINAKRAQGAYCGPTWMPPVGPLTMEPHLVKAAQLSANDMFARHWFGHVDPDGRGASQRVGYYAPDYPGSLSLVGENLIDAPRWLTEATVLNNWMSDTDHCVGVMLQQANKVGLAVATGKDPVYYGQGLPEDQIPDSIIWDMITGTY
ncbi:MAG: CAP domain-containing protein [Candidatus Nanopelagicales bacterium]